MSSFLSSSRSLDFSPGQEDERRVKHVSSNEAHRHGLHMVASDVAYSDHEMKLKFVIVRERNRSNTNKDVVDLERGGSGSCVDRSNDSSLSANIEIDPVLGRSRNRSFEIEQTLNWNRKDSEDYVAQKGVVPTVGASLKSIWDVAVVFFVDGYGDRSHSFSMLSLLLPVVLLFAVNLKEEVHADDLHVHKQHVENDNGL
ncbi:hypothetical protein L6452_34680 [Arctium lappa]|uniref:Uncharacterized protein n=1 Tax=Arctium lappa TaxID=4217 RepID=A0ACB8YJ49_ARCLA|nr:hypothetical protein L6452_34680 [Arctium lappa]